MITTNMRPDNTLEIYNNNMFIASFIWGEADKRLGLVNPEMRYFDKDNYAHQVIFVGATPKGILDQLEIILKRQGLI